jgi:hypothetical protein
MLPKLVEHDRLAAKKRDRLWPPERALRDFRRRKVGDTTSGGEEIEETSG